VLGLKVGAAMALLVLVVGFRRQGEDGRNPLLAYLLPGLIGNAAALTGTLVHANIDRWLWPFYGAGGLPGMLNALVMTVVVLLIPAELTRAGLRLKL
jgi:hypothetical protein